APSVGTMIPSSGLSPCERAAGPPPAPLASAYRPVAVAKAWPTSMPVIARYTQYARDAATSRACKRTSAPNAPGGTKPRASGERKNHVVQVAGSATGVPPQLFDGTRGNHAAAVEQHEAIADASGIAQLVNGEEQRASGGAMRRQHAHHLARL